MKPWLAVAIGLVWVSAGVGGAFAAGPPSEPTASISRDEKDVYDAVLASWLGDEPGRQLVNETLSPPPSSADPEFAACTKGLDFPRGDPGGRGPKSLVAVQFARPGIELIDGSKWKPLDPGDGIARGKSVDAAVDEGFAHSLISFSQVAFSSDGTDALVKFSMVCGRLCGTGSTMRLHKSGGRWAPLKQCGGGWIS